MTIFFAPRKPNIIVIIKWVATCLTSASWVTVSIYGLTVFGATIVLQLSIFDKSIELFIYCLYAQLFFNAHANRRFRYR
jgi:hypothetical protein